MKETEKDRASRNVEYSPRYIVSFYRAKKKAATKLIKCLFHSVVAGPLLNFHFVNLSYTSLLAG